MDWSESVRRAVMIALLMAVGAFDGPLRSLPAVSAEERAGQRPAPAESAQRTGVIVNGEALTYERLEDLEEAYRVRIRPGRYWYDTFSGLWGEEGEPSLGQINPGLKLGGALRRDASAGKTGLIVNGRELPDLEAAAFGRLGSARPGRYWLNAAGVGGLEGQAPSVNLREAGVNGWGDYGWNRTTPRDERGGDESCFYFFDPAGGGNVMNCK